MCKVTVKRQLVLYTQDRLAYSISLVKKDIVCNSVNCVQLVKLFFRQEVMCRIMCRK